MIHIDGVIFERYQLLRYEPQIGDRIVLAPGREFNIRGRVWAYDRSTGPELAVILRANEDYDNIHGDFAGLLLSRGWRSSSTTTAD